MYSNYFFNVDRKLFRENATSDEPIASMPSSLSKFFDNFKYNFKKLKKDNAKTITELCQLDRESRRRILCQAGFTRNQIDWVEKWLCNDFWQETKRPMLCNHFWQDSKTSKEKQIQFKELQKRIKENQKQIKENKKQINKEKQKLITV